MQTEKKFERILLIEEIIGSIIVLAVILFCAFSEKPLNTSLRLERELGHIENWSVNGDADMDFPVNRKMLAGEEIVLEATLPETIPANYALSTYSIYSAVIVSVDGEKIYSYAENPSTPVGRITGNIRCIIPLDESMEGKKINITFIPYYTQHADISEPIFDSAGTIKCAIIYANLFKLVIVTVLLSIFMCDIWIIVTDIISNSHINARMSAYFALFIFSTLTWITCSSDLPQIFGDGNGTAAYISYTCISLFSFAYAGFCRQLFAKGKMHFAVLQILSGIVPIVNSLAFAFDIYDPPQSLIVSHACIFAAAVMSMFFAICDRKNGMHGKVILTATVVLILFVAMGLFCYYTVPSRGYDGTIMSIGMLIYISLLFTLILARQVSTIGERKYMDLYKQMAYSDILTSMGNRTGFDREFARFFENGEIGTDVSLVVFDVNYLKVTNDTKGHQAGDELIISMAHLIQKCFGRHGNCFRLGGDEFAVVCFNQREMMEGLLQDFDDAIALQNTKGDMQLSCARGLCNMKYNGEKDFKKDIFAKADKEMYLDKQIKHLAVTGEKKNDIE